MQKMYATSWKLFTLTAKADRVVMFLTVFFLWMDKMSCCYQESSVIHGWFVYWVFGWEMGRLSKFGNSISDDIVFVFHLAKCVRGFKILEQLWPSLIAFRTESRMVSLSNYCIWCLFLLYLISWSRAQFTLTVYAESLCTFVGFESMIWPSIRFDISLQNFKKPSDIFAHRK